MTQFGPTPGGGGLQGLLFNVLAGKLKLVTPEQYTSSPYSGDQSVILQKMFDAVGANQGIILLSGFLSFSTPINAKYPNITVMSFNEGAGVFYKGAGLVYTGTGAATAIDATAQTAQAWVNIELTYTNAGFTGTLLDMSGVAAVADGSLHKFINLLIRPFGVLDSHFAMIKGDRTHSWDILNCVGNASAVFYGKSSNATFANRWNIVGGYWQGRTNAPFKNPDQGWKWDSFTSEPKTDGSPGLYDHDAGVTSRGLTLINPLFGDETVAGSWCKHGGENLTIIGGSLGAAVAGGDSIVQITDDNSGPILIMAADTHIATTSYLVDLNGKAGTLPITVRSNRYSNIPNNLINGTVPYGSFIENPNAGLAEYIDGTHSHFHWADASGRVIDHWLVIGDTQLRFSIASNGTLRWGSGSIVNGDILLQRSAAGILNLTNGKFTATNGIGVGNSAAATTLGSVVKRMQIFDAAGASLGFIPIYDAIT